MLCQLRSASPAHASCGFISASFRIGSGSWSSWSTRLLPGNQEEGRRGWGAGGRLTAGRPEGSDSGSKQHGGKNLRVKAPPYGQPRSPGTGWLWTTATGGGERGPLCGPSMGGSAHRLLKISIRSAQDPAASPPGPRVSLLPGLGTGWLAGRQEADGWRGERSWLKISRNPFPTERGAHGAHPHPDLPYPAGVPPVPGQHRVQGNQKLCKHTSSQKHKAQVPALNESW